MDLKHYLIGALILAIAFILSGGGIQRMAMPHQRAAAPLHVLIVIIFGLLALAAIVGGIIAIVYSSKANTEFSLLGAKLSTGDVGVAFVGIGLVISYFTIRAVLKSARDLAALPLDERRKPRRSKKPKNP